MIRQLAVHLDGAAPIPLSNGGELEVRRLAVRLNELRINQWEKCLPPDLRSRQGTIRSPRIQSDRPKFVMIRLAHFHLCHPIKNFARIEVAKDSAFELREQWWMHRIAEIQQCVRAGQSCA